MTTMIEPDTRGVDALTGQLDGNLLQPLIFQQLEQEMSQQFADAPWPQQLPEFDEAAWQQLPTVADIEELWMASTPVESLIMTLAHRAHGEGPDLMEFMSLQWQLADLELGLKRAREASDAEGADDDGGAGGAAGLVSAETGRSGGDLPGRPENGVTVGKGRKTRRKKDSGGPSEISGGEGPGEAAG